MTLPRAHGGPVAQGILRASPEDFVVIEQLGFEPGGEGEHLWLLLRKREWNTTDLALALARWARLPLRAVGYSGLKDRVAVADQWFSLHLPGKADPELTGCRTELPSSAPCATGASSTVAPIAPITSG